MLQDLTGKKQQLRAEIWELRKGDSVRLRIEEALEVLETNIQALFAKDTAAVKAQAGSLQPMRRLWLSQSQTFISSSRTRWRPIFNKCLQMHLTLQKR